MTTLADSVSSAHPEPWGEYLENVPIARESGIIRLHTESNSHYLVVGERVLVFYGYHGRVAYSLAVNGGPAAYLAEVDRISAEISSLSS